LLWAINAGSPVREYLPSTVLAWVADSAPLCSIFNVAT